MLECGWVEVVDSLGGLLTKFSARHAGGHGYGGYNYYSYGAQADTKKLVHRR